MSQIIKIQEHLRRALPAVLGCKDYQEEKKLLERVDQVLRTSGVESRFLMLSRAQFENAALERQRDGASALTGGRALERHIRHSVRALRCTVLKALLGGSYRELSVRLAHSPLYRWFCGCEDFALIRVPGKSTLNDYAHWLPAERMEEVLDQLTQAVSDEGRAREIGLANELDVTVAWVDTTCLEANVHFPTDWVLLRDGARTILACVETIRRHGLRHRMPEPRGLLGAINAQAMAMSAAGRKPGSRKARKKCLRAMKKICRRVEDHGRRYRQILDTRWQQSDLTRKEAEVILRRLDNVLEQLPQARRQAHERIIGERPVDNARKILSLYERDIHLIVRGKAGARIEYGNSLFVAETTEGFILDHQLRKEASPGDAKWLAERLGSLQTKSGHQLCGIATDRGFDSKANRALLAKEGIFNGLCPRDPGALTRRHKTDEVFAGVQQRRGPNEGRIGILKNVFLDECPRAKGFAHRQLQVAWAVFAHNLWVIARQPWGEEEAEKAQAA